MIKEVLRHESDPFYPFAFGVLTSLWGLWLLLPGSSYAVTHGFDNIKNYVPEDFLGAVALGLGICQIVGVLKKKAELVQFLGYISFYFWLLLSISFVSSNWNAPSFVLYLWVAIMNGLGYVNHKLNQK